MIFSGYGRVWFRNLFWREKLYSPTNPVLAAASSSTSGPTPSRIGRPLLKTGSSRRRRKRRLGKEEKEDEEEEVGLEEVLRFLAPGLIVSSSLVAASRGRPWRWRWRCPVATTSASTATMAVECPRRVGRKLRKIVFGLSLLFFWSISVCSSFVWRQVNLLVVWNRSRKESKERKGDG